MAESDSIGIEKTLEEDNVRYSNGTVKQRIISHLSGISSKVAGASSYSYLPKYVCQDGIAEAVGVSRGHAAIELLALQREGIVGVKLAHITGVNRRRKVYYVKEGEV